MISKELTDYQVRAISKAAEELTNHLNLTAWSDKELGFFMAKMLSYIDTVKAWKALKLAELELLAHAFREVNEADREEAEAWLST